MTFERFTDRLRRVMQFAQQEAARLEHDWIGTEHLLLGLCKEGSSTAIDAIRSFGTTPEAVRGAIERICPPSNVHISIEMRPRTPRADKVLEYAVAEAAAHHHIYVGTEHLLCAMFRETGGVAFYVLASLGGTYAAAREWVSAKRVATTVMNSVQVSISEEQAMKTGKEAAMNHCKDCRFWSLNPAGFSGYGSCLRLPLSTDVRDQRRRLVCGMAVIRTTKFNDPLPEHELGLIVPADFGCVHFESKEQV